VKLSIVIPTCGRPTLARTLQSLAEQPLDPSDEVLVAGGPVCRMIPAAHYGATYVPVPAGKDWGCRERTEAIARAGGTHLAFIDDDDWWLPGARAAIADAMEKTPTVPVLFRMRYRTGRELWAEPELRVGNVSTQMILIPNDANRLGKWTKRREGDYDFLASMRWPRTDIVWRNDVIAQIGKDR
jgi:hypothetical protein